MRPLAPILAACAALASSAAAEHPPAPCTAITGARVWLPPGPQDGAAVLLEGDRIVDVRLAAPGEPVSGPTPQFRWYDRTCSWIDGSGLQLTAGLVDADTQLGLVEVGAEGASHNAGSSIDDPVRAHLRVAEGYNPWSTVIPVTRLQGITATVVHPRGGLVAGLSAAASLAGATQDAAILNPAVAMRVEAGAAPSMPDLLMRLRDLLDDARLAAREPKAVQTGATRALAASAADLEALRPVVERKLPLWIAADRAADLEALARFARTQGVRIIVQGAAEGWRVADLLRDADITAVVDPFVYGAGGFDQIHGDASNPAALASAGVRVVIATGSAHFSRTLRQLAGNAVRGGMAAVDALAAITSAPAAAFGLTDVGRIEAGVRADLVLWSGDPLELTSTVRRLLIGGREIPLVSRQTVLRERYRDLPGSPTPPLPLP